MVDEKKINLTEIQETMTSVGLAFQQKVEELRPVFELIIDGIKFFAEAVNEWQKSQKQNVRQLAECGWFPNWLTFFYDPEPEINDLDQLMIMHLDDCWSEVTKRIVELCPERKHILEAAFELHKQGNYIASIPLFLSQSDGICSEEFTYFFTKNNITGKKASDEILEQFEKGELVVDFFTEILIEPFKIKTQLSQGSSKSSMAAKENGPNRHGIIHGSRKHLDYGSKLNSYKAFSFLAFIVFTTKGSFKGHWQELWEKHPGDFIKINAKRRRSE
jgi:hypothetical protein